MTSAQLVLELGHRPALGREDFLVSAANENAVAWIDRWPDWPGRGLILYGPPGCGKTHLAQVWCAVSGAELVEASALGDPDLARLTEPGAAAVVEGADGGVDQRALLALYNVLASNGAGVLLTARCPPAAWPIELPDLCSRLAALPAAAVAAPDDQTFAAVLVKLLADRQPARRRGRRRLSLDPPRAHVRGRARGHRRARFGGARGQAQRHRAARARGAGPPPEGGLTAMDLGIAGKTAIVCASSKGLGRGCAFSLARAGARIILNARGAEALHATAEEIRAATGAEVIEVAADIAAPEGRAEVLAAAPAPDILINNAGGPPPGDFRDWDRAAWNAALEANMLTPIDLIKATVDGMISRRFGRIVNITSSAVKSPIATLGLSNGARGGLTGFIAGLARQVAAHNVTINNLLPGAFDTDPAARAHGREHEGGAAKEHPGGPLRRSGRVRRCLRLPVQRPSRLRHHAELPHRRRRLPGHALVTP